MRDISLLNEGLSTSQKDPCSVVSLIGTHAYEIKNIIVSWDGTLCNVVDTNVSDVVQDILPAFVISKAGTPLIAYPSL
jgi:hypothetical protein